MSTSDNAASARHVEGAASVSMGDNAANAGTVEGTRLLTNHSGAGRKLKRTTGDAGLIETDGFEKKTINQAPLGGNPPKMSKINFGLLTSL